MSHLSHYRQFEFCCHYKLEDYSYGYVEHEIDTGWFFLRARTYWGGYIKTVDGFLADNLEQALEVFKSRNL